MLLVRVLLLALSALWRLPAAETQGMRVVDVVKVGDETSEREHEFAGEGTTLGAFDGRTFRQTLGSLSYSMAVYEDTEVVLSCLFRGSEGHRLALDLFVEGRRVLTHTVTSPSSQPVSAEFRVPFEITKGLTTIHVTLRAVDGPTPALLELRTVQEHLEWPPAADARGAEPGPPAAAF